MDKKLFKGEFNVSGETIKLHTQAIHGDRAFKNFMLQLSKKYNYSMHHFQSMFDGSKDNYFIEEVER